VFENALIVHRHNINCKAVKQITFEGGIETVFQKLMLLSFFCINSTRHSRRNKRSMRYLQTTKIIKSTGMDAYKVQASFCKRWHLQL